MFTVSWGNGAEPGVDLTQLPVASGQVPQYSTYDALDVPGMASGAQYNDPLTDVLITKISDSTTPVSNTNHSSDYSSGPLQISQPWGVGGDMYTLKTILGNTGAGYLVDYQLGGTLSNWRAAPVGSDTQFCFSYNPATPQIAYYLDGTTLHRYDTATDADADTGNFPATGQGTLWLQGEANDDWFVSSDNTTVYAFKASDNTKLSRSGGPNFDEPYFEHNGRYVFLVNNDASFPGPYPNIIWDLTDDSIDEFSSIHRVFHSAALYGHWTGEDVDAGGNSDCFRLKASDHALTEFWDMGGYASDYHDAGQWLQPEVTDTEQYFLKTMYQEDNEATSDLLGVLALIRLDGADIRILAHHYSQRDGLGSYFDSYCRSTISPDGFLVMFTSDMNNVGSRGDLFVAELPR